MLVTEQGIAKPIGAAATSREAFNRQLYPFEQVFRALQKSGLHMARFR